MLLLIFSQHFPGILADIVPYHEYVLLARSSVQASKLLWQCVRLTVPENKEQCSIYDDKIISGHVFSFFV